MLSIKPEMVIKELTSRKFQVAKTEDVISIIVSREN